MPIAMVLWILGGTQRYYKMWFDNFTKLLILFPLIAGMIVIGRIFAWIVGDGNPNGFATSVMTFGHHLNYTFALGTAGILDLMAIFIGYFGVYYLLPKAITSWGGSIMSSATKGIQGGIAPLKNLGKKEIDGTKERWQGKKAKQYNPNAGRAQRAYRRFQSGSFLPTERSRRLTIQKGDKWQGEQDDMALALLKRSGEKVMAGYETAERNADGEMVDAGGNVVQDYAQAAKKTLSGVAAMKQKWVDLVDDDKADAAVKKMAIRQLIATSSWPEIQGSYSSKGRRVHETEAWVASVTTSPEDYPKVLRSRVDAAPHIEEAAYVEGIQAGYGRDDNSVAARQFRSSNRINYAVQKQMGNEDFATQSDGFWDEVGKMANANIVDAQGNAVMVQDVNGNTVAQQDAIRNNLHARFAAIHAAGPTVRQQMLGHLMDGGALEKSVNSALGAGAVTGAGPGRLASYL
jgi:hypothetical protein